MKCQAKTNSGRRCSKNAQEGGEYCAIHAGKVAADSPIVDENELPETDMDHEVSDTQSINTVNVREVEEIVQRMSFGTNAELLLQVQMLKTQVDVLKTQLEETRKSKKITPEQVAKRAFYYKNKNSAEIIDEIKKRLVNVGMYMPDKPVPWQLIRAATDTLFDTLSPEQKAQYLPATV